MRLTRLVLLLFGFNMGVVAAQQRIIDSLENQLLHPTNGLSKVENLNFLGYYYARTKPIKGLQRTDEAIALAFETGDSLRLGFAYEYKGLNHKNLGNDSLALILYDKAAKVYEAVGNERSLSILLLNKGVFSAQRSRHLEALEDFGKALDIFTKDKDTLLMGYTLGRLGFSQIYIGEYTASLSNFLKGAKLLEKIDKQDSMHYGSIQGDLGLLYQKLSDYEAALAYHEKAVAVFTSNDYQTGVLGQYNNIGNIYTKQKEYKKALEIYETTYELKKKTGNKAQIVGGLSNLGSTYCYLNQLDKARLYLDSTKVMYAELNDYDGLSFVNERLGSVYLKKGQLSNARRHFDAAVTQANKSGNIRAVFLAKLGLAETAALQAEFKTAYNTLKNAIDIKEKLLSEGKIEELATLKATYEYDKEKALLQADFEKKKAIDDARLNRQILVRNTVIGGSILTMGALVLGFSLVRIKRAALYNEKLVNSKLQTIRAQLNPHFIFNTLNSIHDHMLRNDKDVAGSYLVSFSKMMRQVLENSEQEEIALANEIIFLDNYIQLEQQRLENSFKYEINIRDTIDAENIYLPPALLQPFVENSIWHGLSDGAGMPGLLLITMNKRQNLLVCTIEDKGNGQKVGKKSIVADHISFGNKNAQNRLDLLNELRGSSDAKVVFDKRSTGFCVTVYIPISEEL